MTVSHITASAGPGSHVTWTACLEEPGLLWSLHPYPLVQMSGGGAPEVNNILVCFWRQASAVTVEQELREAYLNKSLAENWLGGQEWAALDYNGLVLSRAAATAHKAKHRVVNTAVHFLKTSYTCRLATIAYCWRLVSSCVPLGHVLCSLCFTQDWGDDCGCWCCWVRSADH